MILTDAASSQAQGVNEQSIDPGLVGYVSEYDSANGIGSTDYGDEQSGGLFIRDPSFFGQSLEPKMNIELGTFEVQI